MSCALLSNDNKVNVMINLYYKHPLMCTFPSNKLSYWGVGQLDPLIDSYQILLLCSVALSGKLSVGWSLFWLPAKLSLW
jgi:hypothetical protein